MSLKHSLVAIERKLWKNDAALYHDNLHDDALLLFPETGPISRDTAVDAIRQENAEGRHWAEVEFSDERLIELSDDVAVLIYRSKSRWADDTKFIHALCSSTYVRRNGVWKLALHQQAAVEG
jgi:hypothetical protein